MVSRKDNFNDVELVSMICIVTVYEINAKFPRNLFFIKLHSLYSHYLHIKEREQTRIAL